jgi:DNA-binding helix-hairpin-helix protein with protein kinase domain
MTTRHSSSHLAATPTTLLDSICRPIHLGPQMGRGGEGSVFEVEGQPTQVAKVYHKRPLPDEQVAKLEAMVSCWSSSLEMISSWPRALLFDPTSRKPSGILMSKMEGARPLHELYGTTNRRRHFPEAGWHHLILAARNTAAAFHTMHTAGVVVGDVNQGNLLVDKQMCVRMIDCDSFQIASNGRTYHCPVGTPHFTPPELQSQKLRDVTRTVNHDRFGLAILIFHLLFVGRHPFAGRYHGPGDLTIEKAIAERRFAFSKNRAATLVDPPPASLLLDDLPAGVAQLFEAAFRYAPDSADALRPSPMDWVSQLEAMMKRRRTCKFDSMHVYAAELDECPWCRIEDAGGPSFFVPAGGATIVSADRLAVLDEKILRLPGVHFPDLTQRQLELPHMPPLRPLKDRPKITQPDVFAGLLVASWAACAAAVAFGGSLGLSGLGALAALGGCIVLSLMFTVLLIISKPARARRKTVDDFNDWLAKAQEALDQRGQLIAFQHRQREVAFQRSTDDFKNEVHNYRTADDNLQSVLVQHREAQKSDFLRCYLIRDYYRKIPGLSPSQVIMLESYGVESANDLERLRLYGIPSIDGELVIELMHWRSEVERGFTFNPEHGITLADVGAAKEAAVRRYKISQARRILTGAKQLEVLAAAGRSELTRALTQFNQAADQWRNVATQLRDFQSGRRSFERLINRSAASILGIALSAAFAFFVLMLIVAAIGT